MTRMKYLVAAATLSLALVGCSGSKEEVPDNPPNEIYATAQQKLQDGNWKQAITQLEALDNRYPFGPYSQQVQLDLIYAYYKNADLPLAQAKQIQLLTTGTLSALQAAAQRWLDLPPACCSHVAVPSASTLSTTA